MRISQEQCGWKEEKKLLKPLMEKRRRDRINLCLERLRTLLTETTQDERLKNPKAEKAEILKKTVQFLKLQRLSDEKRAEDRKVRGYQHGYQECLLQAAQFLESSPGLCTRKRSYLLDRVCHFLGEAPSHFQEPPRPELARPESWSAASSPPQDYRKAGRLQCPGDSFLHRDPPHLPAPSGSGSFPPTVQRLQAAPGPEQRICQRALPQRLYPVREDSATPCQALRVWRPWP
uniref:Transcription factor HES-7.1-like n=1 Tax=Geotrypetes seraphini TaxID=260995 RepID=A0A6P8PEJ7_GEOSA|nr:transcription factor HES-7.1-like [Geotrypetes seraphini]